MLDWIKLGIICLSVLILPGLARYISGRLNISKNASDIVLERSERIAGDNSIRERCELTHKAVDGTLTDLKAAQLECKDDIKTVGKTVVCMDKKMTALLASNGVDFEEEA